MAIDAERIEVVREWCHDCPTPVVGRMAATGHLVGAWYASVEHEHLYRVEDTCTLWELAPEAGVRRRWANGNITMSDLPRGEDRLVCDDCGERRRVGSQAGTATRAGTAT